MPIHFYLRYRFRTVHGNLYLSATNQGIVLSHNPDAEGQWVLRPSQNGHGCFIHSAGRQTHVLLANGDREQLTLAEIWETDRHKWQLFEINHQDVLVVALILNQRIDNRLMCAEVQGGNVAPNTPVILFSIAHGQSGHLTYNQLWRPEIVGPA